MDFCLLSWSVDRAFYLLGQWSGSDHGQAPPAQLELPGQWQGLVGWLELRGPLKGALVGGEQELVRYVLAICSLQLAATAGPLMWPVAWRCRQIHHYQGDVMDYACCLGELLLKGTARARDCGCLWPTGRSSSERLIILSRLGCGVCRFALRD